MSNAAWKWFILNRCEPLVRRGSPHPLESGAGVTAWLTRVQVARAVARSLRARRESRHERLPEKRHRIGPEPPVTGHHQEGP
jgi:hypothetical protein